MNERQSFAYHNPINYGEPTDLYVAQYKCDVAGVEATITSALLCSREREAFDGRPYWAVVCGVTSLLNQPLMISSLEEPDLFRMYRFCCTELEGVGHADGTWQIIALGQVTVTLVRAMSDEEISGRGSEWERIRVAEHGWTNVSYLSGAPLDRDATLSAEEIAERDEITRAALEAMEKWEGPIKFELNIWAAVGLIGQLQVAFRHPANRGITRQRLEDLVRDLIERIDPGHGAIHRMLMLGFDERYDEAAGERKAGDTPL